MLLGLYGKARAGKSYIARHLSSQFGLIQISFADPLKELISKLFDMTADQLEEGNAKNVIDERYGMTPRQLMQTLGRNFRAIYPNIWIDQAFRQYRQCVNNVIARKCIHGAVVMDVRLPKEFDAIKDRAGYMIKIVRTHKDGSPYIHAKDDTAKEITETALDDLNDASFDAVITAVSGDVSGLAKQAKEAVESFYRREANANV